MSNIFRPMNIEELTTLLNQSLDFGGQLPEVNTMTPDISGNFFTEDSADSASISISTYLLIGLGIVLVGGILIVHLKKQQRPEQKVVTPPNRAFPAIEEDKTSINTEGNNAVENFTQQVLQTNNVPQLNGYPSLGNTSQQSSSQYI